VLFKKEMDTLSQHNNNLKKTIMNKSGKSSTIGSLGMKWVDLQSMVNDRGYVNLTFNISGSEDNYGNNVSAWKSQTKEEREAEAKKIYAGNGKILWTDSNDVLKPQFKKA
jgi:hypothetical protein